MKVLLAALLLAFATSCANKTAPGNAGSLYDFTMENLEGEKVNLSDYKGKVVIVVNTASKCGFTPQYGDLQAFYNDYKDKGVEILGFPANNFMGQEPGSDEDILTFCSKNYGVSFPMFSKISVKGKDMHPLYKYLTTAVGHDISWNFNKIVVDKNGKPIHYFKSNVKPEDEEFTKAITDLL